MTMNQIQIQERRKQSTYAKAVCIAASRRIHKSSKGNIWMVESDNPKVKNRFYCVHYIEGELYCDCPAFQFNTTNPCKHIVATALKSRVGGAE
ncbi:MAG: SWIM zinc finger family protein [Nitrososphaeraceae archaeon]